MPAPQPATPVWDLPTRLMHWGLAGAVATAAVTGYLAPEWWMGLHVWAGFALGGLVLVRLTHGVFGPGPSRLRRLVFPPREIVRHLRLVLSGRPEHYPGHNPAGAAMAIALLAVLTAIAVTGLLVLGGEETLGPLAGLVDYATGAGAKPVHYALSGLLLVMIGGHLLGVLVESLLRRENLARAMVTGRRGAAADAPPAPHPRPPRGRPTALAALVVGSLSTLGALAATRTPLPAVGTPVTAAYRSACGECHHAYHPSLLPAESWGRLMAGLGDHFGEDATLDGAAAGDIAAYLTAHAAEAWDTEAANRFRAAAPDRPARITATPFWVRKHADIDRSVFARPAVAARGNCPACHRDADGGRFADRRIAIPPEEIP